MNERRLNCRGLPCPQPVLKTKELVDTGETEQVTVVVDNEAARDNVTRFLERSGYRVMVWQEDEDFAVSGFRLQTPEQAACQIEKEAAPDKKILVLVGTDRLGRGDDDLGRKLLINFLSTLKEMGRDLWCLVLVNAGVKLAAAGSEVLAGLLELEALGAQVLVCGTCLNHFQLLEQKKVGETTNMLDIVSHMQMADRVITLT